MVCLIARTGREISQHVIPRVTTQGKVETRNALSTHLLTQPEPLSSPPHTSTSSVSTNAPFTEPEEPPRPSPRPIGPSLAPSQHLPFTRHHDGGRRHGRGR
jgi:hypothetical protein